MSSFVETSHQLPAYQKVVDDLMVLELPVQVSHLHGLLSAWIVANQSEQAEHYLRSLLLNKKDLLDKQGLNTLFSLYTITQTSLNEFGFDFEILLPDLETSLPERIMAFSDWMLGFLEALSAVGFGIEECENEESVEILEHFQEFAQMDADELDYDNEDEKAYTEVTEYARLAVMQLLCEFSSTDKAHALKSQQH